MPVAGRIVPAGELSLPGTMAPEKAFFGGLPGTCLEAPSRIVSVADHRWEGRPCWRVEVTGKGGAAGEIHYVDPRTPSPPLRFRYVTITEM